MSASNVDSYDDGLVQLDREAITLRRYHFPSGTSKIIALSKVRGYRAEPLGLVLHRFRIWGSSDLRRWLPLDVRRPSALDADHPGRAGHQAQSGVHAGGARRVHRAAGSVARRAGLAQRPASASA